MVDLWMPDAERIETLACGGGSFAPIAVMSHIMQGSQSTMIAWARQRPAVDQKSAHFTIGKDGRICQHVALDKRSWAAGVITGKPTWPLWNGRNPNGQVVNIEHEGMSGDAWPDAQVEATIKVHHWLFGEFGWTPGSDTVIGHFETSTIARAFDPGSGWPRQRIIDALRARTRAAGAPQPASAATDATSPAEAAHGDASVVQLTGRIEALEADQRQQVKRIDTLEHWRDALKEAIEYD